MSISLLHKLASGMRQAASWGENRRAILRVDTNAAVMHLEASFLVHTSGVYPLSRWSDPMELDSIAVIHSLAYIMVGACDA